MLPSFDMSPFGDSALGDFMYGLEANSFGSMLGESGIPPLGFGPEYGDSSGDSDDSSDSSDSSDSDDSSDSGDSDNEEDEDDTNDEDSCDDDSDSSSSGDSSDDSDSQPRKRRLKEKKVDDSSSSDDSSEEEAEDWALWEKKIKKEHQAKAAAQKKVTDGPSKDSLPAQPPKESQKTHGATKPTSSMAADKSPISPSNDSKSASPPDKIQERQDGPDSTASTAEEKSTEARNRGNDLYRKGLFDEATKAYFEALSLTPNDSAPLSNLSAVQFELGNYPGSALYAEKALKLLQDEADSNPKKQKLLSRLARAQILQLKDAAPLVSKLASSDTTRSSATTQHGGQRESVTWTKLLDEIPRYRPTL